jgi:DNA polymerase III delta prime subunit
METTKKNTQKMDLLTAVEQVVELSKSSHLDAGFYRKAARPIKYLKERLELTREQSVMMALFIDNSNSSSINIGNFAKHLECSTTKVIRLTADIDELEQRGFVRRSREYNGTFTYRVPINVIEAFKKNNNYNLDEYKGLECIEFFGALEDILGMRDKDEISTESATKRIMTMLDDNKHLIYVQKVLSYGLTESETILLVLFSNLYANNNDDNIGYHDLSFYYDKKIEWNRIKNQLSRNSHILQTEKIIEYNNDNGFVERDSFRMTWKAKMELFPELNLAELREDNYRKGIVKHEDIVAKELFYDDTIAAQVADLGQLLEEAHYREICKRLEEKGCRSGFTCLFYGAPGTGKTETVLQLARQTGRDIMQVNISEIKSKWVGESEKNIKRLFDQYRMKIEKAAIAPILLFNEADAIIGRRKEGAERAVEKMENSIQNIILQEMENLNGILIATTNLVQNMDQAFERRFLYKIKFNKPTMEARMKIWQTMLPELPEEHVGVLAERFDFSGGQIENIARHYTIDSILHGDTASSLESLMTHCEGERLEMKEHRRIGF